METMLERMEKRAQEYLNYFIDLPQKDPVLAKEEAQKELIRMGLLNSDGSKKDVIVSWE